MALCALCNSVTIYGSVSYSFPLCFNQRTKLKENREEVCHNQLTQSGITCNTSCTWQYQTSYLYTRFDTRLEEAGRREGERSYEEVWISRGGDLQQVPTCGLNTCTTKLLQNSFGVVDDVSGTYYSLLKRLQGRGDFPRVLPNLTPHQLGYSDIPVLMNKLYTACTEAGVKERLPWRGARPAHTTDVQEEERRNK